MLKVIRNLALQRIIHRNQRVIKIACLLRQEDWHPLKAPWWRGKEAYIIGADLDGNFILRHSSGSVGLWEHNTQSELLISKSVKDFLQEIAKSEMDFH